MTQFTLKFASFLLCHYCIFSPFAIITTPLGSICPPRSFFHFTLSPNCQLPKKLQSNGHHLLMNAISWSFHWMNTEWYFYPLWVCHSLVHFSQRERSISSESWVQCISSYGNQLLLWECEGWAVTDSELLAPQIPGSVSLRICVGICRELTGHLKPVHH